VNHQDGKEEITRLKLGAQRLVGQFLRVVAQSPASLLLLDYDGTLAPFQRDREKAFPYAGVVQTLQAIVYRGRTRVVIISGREASEVVRLLGIQPRPEVWGLHGAQRLNAAGDSNTLPVDERDAEALAAAHRWLDDQHLRHTAEVKAGSIAVHWRGLEDREAEEIRRRVLMGWMRIAERSNLSVLEFDGGIELRATAFDKGDAVRALLDEMPVGTPVAYLGDDTTDEPAFRAVENLGLSVLVRSRWRHTAAKLWLRPPAELLDFLQQWLVACRGRANDGGQAAMAVRR
jgi:trehalose 6-phosphate phosphatase